MQRVPDKINFSEEEEHINADWQHKETFRHSLKQAFTNDSFTFYDGPPFATGLPHYGHMSAGTVKDIVTRFAHQSGRYVMRRFGWDCHGLPVEYEIDKALNIKGPDDVARMGIGNYNAECRKIVMRYSSEWETIMTRMARWIDFEEDYKTMYPWYMESIWFIFRELFTKGLVYRGVKVMPYSTRCNTPLSNFESGQNYKDVVDPQVTVGFPLTSEPHIQLVAWTTTPWTLPSNLAVCVHPDLIYVKVKSLKNNQIYILMESRLCMLFKTSQQYEIIDRFPGNKLSGLRYEPLFPYFSHLYSSGAFRVLTDKYVTDDAGTGIVQQAPYFGEDDYRVCLAAGIITKDQEIICPVDASGCFTEPVKDFLKMHVKDADKHILQYLKQNSPTRLLDASTVKHSYPFCWRSDTPLIYRAVPSWFVRVETMVDSLLSANQATYWVPDFVKEKRFGNWLKGARDWAISRNRYWGTPIPLWSSEDGKEIVCVGSLAQLEELTGQKVTDLHRETVDLLTIPSVRPGMPPLRRVPEVFDCWFESGSMPYAQVHFPFSRDIEMAFHNGFPADFISEGIDQTRGWFYTLLVISTAIFNKAPYKNLIASGLVLASDGQKMSKSKKNYPDPMEVVKKYGADALRLYLINSPVVRAENLRFKDDGVKDVLKDVLLPWYNAYRYLVQSYERLLTEEQVNIMLPIGEDNNDGALNIMDKWIRSATQTMVSTAWREMQRYHLYKVVPLLVNYIDQLTNWYIRMNRKRLKGDSGKDDCIEALKTLFIVMYTFVRIMAPFTPYICELMFKNLKKQLNEPAESVHLTVLPHPIASHIDLTIERRVAAMQYVISAGRLMRDKRAVPIKYPLPELIIIHKDIEYLEDMKLMESYILEELNVKKMIVSNECEKYHVTLGAQVDHKALGARLKGDFKSVLKAVQELTDADVQRLVKNGDLLIKGHSLTLNDVFISYRFDENLIDKQSYEIQGSQEMAIMLGMQRNAAMLDEGLAREIVNLVQKLRKKAQVVPTDPITIYYRVDPPDSDMSSIILCHYLYLETSLRAPLRPASTRPASAVSLIAEKCQPKGTRATIDLEIVRGYAADWNGARSVEASLDNKPNALSPNSGALNINGNNVVTQALRTCDVVAPITTAPCLTPSVKYVVVHPIRLPIKNDPFQGLLVTLDNPTNASRTTCSGLIETTGSFYGLPRQSFILVNKNGQRIADSEDSLSEEYNGTTVYATLADQQIMESGKSLISPIPNQPFANVCYKDKYGLVFLVTSEGELRKATEVVAEIAQLFGLPCSRMKITRGNSKNFNQLTVTLV